MLRIIRCLNQVNQMIEGFLLLLKVLILFVIQARLSSDFLNH